MKKKELLRIKSLIATDNMINTAESDREEKYLLFFRAAVENEILKVAVFPRKWLVEGKRNPQFEIYLCRKENDFITYEPEEKAWRTAKIDYLNFAGDTYIEKPKEIYECGNSRKIVNDYLGTGNRNVKNAVLDFQYNVRRENLTKKHRNEIEQIDSVMTEVPELPKNFEKWVEKNCFDEYLIYQRSGKKYKAYCTHCNKWVKVKDKPLHNAETQCPNCKVPATYKSWNKQKYLTQRIKVGILQRLQDDTAYILRRFDCWIKRKNEYGWDVYETNFYEDVRVTLDSCFREEEYFEYGQYEYTGIYRWCHRVRKAFGYGERYFGTAIMYTPNMKMVLKKEDFSGCNLKEMFLGGNRKKINPVARLQALHHYPYLEYIQKSGLNRLTEEILRRDERPGLFQRHAKKIHEALKLNKQNFQRLRKVDGNCNVLEVLQWIQVHGEKISDESLLFVRDKKVRIDDLQVKRTNLTVERAVNLIKSQAEKMEMSVGNTYRVYEDYLDMAERRGMDITDEIVCKNNRMMEYHDRYLEEENRKANEKRDTEVDTKFKQIEEEFERNTLHFAFETEDYFIRVPQKASDITNEGRIQHHCVGASDNYLSKMAKGTTYILFLRKKAMPNRPYYTLEVKYNGTVVQKRSMYNRQPDIEKIDEVLKQWQREIKKRCEEKPHAAEQNSTQTSYS